MLKPSNLSKGSERLLRQNDKALEHLLRSEKDWVKVTLLIDSKCNIVGHVYNALMPSLSWQFLFTIADIYSYLERSFNLLRPLFSIP